MKNIQKYQSPFYQSLSLRNFRGFKKAENINIPLAPLTFLVGPNRSGKSSLFDALLLLAQSSLELNGSPPRLPSWGGPLVDLGSFRDTITRHNVALAMEIAVDVGHAPHLFRLARFWGASVSRIARVEGGMFWA